MSIVATGLSEQGPPRPSQQGASSQGLSEYRLKPGSKLLVLCYWGFEGLSLGAGSPDKAEGGGLSQECQLNKTDEQIKEVY